MDMAEVVPALALQWVDEFTGVMETMADVRPDIRLADSEAPGAGEELWWRQPLDASPEAAVWVAARPEAWDALAGRVLSAAGIEESDESEKRSTWLEVLKQSLGGLAIRLGEQIGREVSLSDGAGEEAPPERILRCRLSLRMGGTVLPPLEIAFSPGLTALLEPGAGQSHQDSRESDPVSSHDNGDETAELSGRACRTLDLLLDVEMPVSVSFGRTQVSVQEVLKLITGSIVELDRTIAEPVEVIVNNCVIARGEVVVVEGNYGVRITHVMSRRERLQQSRKYLLPVHAART